MTDWGRCCQRKLSSRALTTGSGSGVAGGGAGAAMKILVAALLLDFHVGLAMITVPFNSKYNSFNSLQLTRFHFMSRLSHFNSKEVQWRFRARVCLKSGIEPVSTTQSKPTDYPAKTDKNGSEIIFPEVEWTQYAWFMLILPSISNVFPYLIQSASSETVPEDKRFLIILFLILKRVYLYAVALSTVDIAARRSTNLLPKLGQRLQQLNEEILGGSGAQSDERKQATR